MSPGDESFPLLKVYRDIGTITEGITNLRDGQKKLNETQQDVRGEIGEIRSVLGNVVTKDICALNHPPRRRPTTDNNGAIGFKPTLLQRLADNAGNITKILTLVASVIIGLWAVHRFATRLEASLVRSEAVQTKTTKQLIRKFEDRPAAVVYVPMPIVPDSGASQPSPRRRRTAPARRAVSPR